MTGFADLISEAMPYLASDHIDATIGADWEWSYEIKDADDVLVDFTTAGCSGECVVRAYTDTLVSGSRTERTLGAVVLSPTVTFPTAGIVTVAATAAETAALEPGTYLLAVKITDSSNRTIVVVGGGSSDLQARLDLSA